MTAKIDGRLLKPSHTLKINGNTINYLKVNGKEFWRNVQPLRITKQPSDKAKKDKETLSLSCAVDAGRSTFVNYRWYRDGAKLGGQTSDTLERKLSIADDGAKWWCRITNDVGTVETRHASTTVKPLKKVIEINENVQNLNLYNEYTRRFPNAEGVEKVEFIIGEGVEVTSSSTSKPALDTGTGWDGKVSLKLSVLSGAGVAGRGGDGGDVSDVNEYMMDWHDGGDGGLAFNVQAPVTVHNYGLIGGGGGGGGGSSDGVFGSITTGSGGASYGIAGSDLTTMHNTNAYNQTTLYSGTKGGFKSGGQGVTDEHNRSRGGKGGDLGENGVDGKLYNGQNLSVMSKGGTAGPAIQGVSNVTFINRGDIRGKTV